MKHYFSLINLGIPLGKGLNALAHTAIGVGHRLPTKKHLIQNKMIDRVGIPVLN